MKKILAGALLVTLTGCNCLTASQRAHSDLIQSDYFQIKLAVYKEFLLGETFGNSWDKDFVVFLEGSHEEIQAFQAELPAITIKHQDQINTNANQEGVFDISTGNRGMTCSATIHQIGLDEAHASFDYYIGNQGAAYWTVHLVRLSDGWRIHRKECMRISQSRDLEIDAVTDSLYARAGRNRGIPRVAEHELAVDSRPAAGLTSP